MLQNILILEKALKKFLFGTPYLCGLPCCCWFPLARVFRSFGFRCVRFITFRAGDLVYHTAFLVVLGVVFRVHTQRSQHEVVTAWRTSPTLKKASHARNLGKSYQYSVLATVKLHVFNILEEKQELTRGNQCRLT